MRFFTISVVLLISAASAVLADDEGLKIDVTEKVECERKTTSGDHILVHYRGTLTNGKEFDASRNRGPPFEFTVGTGQVIKGLVDLQILPNTVLMTTSVCLIPFLIIATDGIKACWTCA
jgi:hypothetical protein